MPGTIIVADATPTQRITLKVKLEAACYRVGAAASVEEAVEAARRLGADMVIADAALPGGGPRELCARLRTAGGTTPPVIVLGGTEGRVAALEAGARDVVARPLDDLFLAARVRQVLSEARMARAADALPEGLAEAATPFAGPPPTARVALVAPEPVTAMAWRQALAGPGVQIEVASAERVLAAATGGRGHDAYIVSADLMQPGDGLRLLSELRAREESRDAAFLIALAPERASLGAVALDLGAGDVLPMAFSPEAAAEARLRLAARLRDKRARDAGRDRAERERIWAVTDPLTGLFNRRVALPRLGAMAQDARLLRRSGAGLAVLALDLDRFKSVNDRHGHAAGDAVLVAVAQRLAGCLRGDDLLARIGGEEFLIAVAADGPGEVAALADRLRRAVSEAPILLPAALGGGSLRVTVSIGTASFDPLRDTGTDAAEALMLRADRALLAAKAAGRDQVVSAAA